MLRCFGTDKEVDYTWRELAICPIVLGEAAIFLKEGSKMKDLIQVIKVGLALDGGDFEMRS